MSVLPKMAGVTKIPQSLSKPSKIVKISLIPQKNLQYSHDTGFPSREWSQHPKSSELLSEHRLLCSLIEEAGVQFVDGSSVFCRCPGNLSF